MASSPLLFPFPPTSTSYRAGAIFKCVSRLRAILYVLALRDAFIQTHKQFYVCALVGVLIKCLYEMHGATMKITILTFTSASIQTGPQWCNAL